MCDIFNPRIDILNAGYVEIIDYMGGDEAIIRGARICYQSHGNEEADRMLIKMLIKQGHKSPLEHCVFQFRVKLPIFVARQWMRHRIGSYTEKSLRYCEANPDFYIPTSNFAETALWTEMYTDMYSNYKMLFESGYCKEQARLVLPLATYTEFIWTVNASSLWNFLELRTDKHAQAEIREYAEAILSLCKVVVPTTFTAIEDWGLKK